MIDMTYAGQTRNQKDIMRGELTKAQWFIEYYLKYVETIPEIDSEEHHELVKQYSKKLCKVMDDVASININD